MGSVMGHRMTAHLAGISDPRLAELAANPDSIVSETTRQTLSPEALEWLRTALSSSLEAVFFAGVFIGILAFLVALAFPAGSAEELASPREETS
jgi:hypothetical protein